MLNSLNLALMSFLALAPFPALAQFKTSYVDGKPFSTGCSPDHCLFALPIYITAEPHSIDDAVAECTNSDLCQAAVVAAAAYVGIDPATMKQAMDAYNVGHRVLSGDQAGSEHHIYFDAPPGYVFCAMAWHTWSVTSGSTVSGSIRHDRRQVGFYANVPVNDWLEGKSWTKTMVQLHAIREGLDWGCSTPIAQNEWGVVIFDENGGSALSGGTFYEYP